MLASAASAESAGTPPGYATARATALEQGREVARLVRAGKAAELHARFAPSLARVAPLAEVRRVLADTGRVGARVGESALPLSPASRGYIADYRSGGRTVGLTVSLDATRTITGINLAPRQPLPAGARPGGSRPVLTLPFRARWWVFWGGPTERQNYHAVAPDQRYAYDLVVWQAGGTHGSAGKRNADYWAWGRPILAPADGRVVAARDGVRDNVPRLQSENRTAPAGNHVVLDLGRGEFALLAHLRRGSVRVRAGQRVRRGQLLGVCGNSGNSSEPHLHFHPQDRARLFGAARGLPVRFADYAVDGRRLAVGKPVQGQFISPVGSPG